MYCGIAARRYSNPPPKGTRLLHARNADADCRTHPRRALPAMSTECMRASIQTSCPEHPPHRPAHYVGAREKGPLLSAPSECPWARRMRPPNCPIRRDREMSVPPQDRDLCGLCTRAARLGSLASGSRALLLVSVRTWPTVRRSTDPGLLAALGGQLEFGGRVGICAGRTCRGTRLRHTVPTLAGC